MSAARRSKSVSGHVPQIKKARRNATVYDAVAERIDAQGFISLDPDPESDEGYLGSQNKVNRRLIRRGSPVAPDEVLFRAQKAPERYEDDEYDLYNADRYLGTGPDEALPDSDLLKMIHGCSSDFYWRATADAGERDFTSMDDTALLACGILLEEACAHILGEEGHMVFTELVEVEQNGELDASHAGDEIQSDDLEREGPAKKRQKFDVSDAESDDLSTADNRSSTD